MLISDSARLLFVHVQKTGGSSVEHWLRTSFEDARSINDLNRHAGLGQILASEPGLASYFIIGCVRNPWSRMLSWHRMIERSKVAVPEGQPLRSAAFFKGNRFARRAAVRLPDFETFVMQGPEQFPRLRRPQVRYLRADGRTADVIARQESLGDDLSVLEDRYGLAPLESSTRRNSDREHVDYRTTYTEEMKQRVAEVFARDIAEFGYEF